jgi:hypothetical protein
MSPLEVLELFVIELRKNSVDRPPNQQEARAFKWIEYFQEYPKHLSLFSTVGRLKNMYIDKGNLELSIIVMTDDPDKPSFLRETEVIHHFSMYLNEANIVWNLMGLNQKPPVFSINICQKIEMKPALSVSLIFKADDMPETWKKILPEIEKAQNY